MSLLSATTSELMAAQDQMVLLGRKTAAEKVATFLLRLSDRKGGERSRKKGAKAKKGTPDLDEASKAELAATAKELEIKGRSTMTRDERTAAIRKAS